MDFSRLTSVVVLELLLRPYSFTMDERGCCCRRVIIKAEVRKESLFLLRKALFLLRRCGINVKKCVMIDISTLLLLRSRNIEKKLARLISEDCLLLKNVELIMAPHLR